MLPWNSGPNFHPVALNMQAALPPDFYRSPKRRLRRLRRAAGKMVKYSMYTAVAGAVVSVGTYAAASNNEGFADKAQSIPGLNKLPGISSAGGNEKVCIYSDAKIGEDITEIFSLCTNADNISYIAPPAEGKKGQLKVKTWLEVDETKMAMARARVASTTTTTAAPEQAPAQQNINFWEIRTPGLLTIKWIQVNNRAKCHSDWQGFARAIRFGAESLGNKTVTVDNLRGASPDTADPSGFSYDYELIFSSDEPAELTPGTPMTSNTETVSSIISCDVDISVVKPNP